MSPTPFDGACTHTTLFVVPRSIPATVARPRNPIFAITTNMSTTTPIAEGINASKPPDLESSECLLAILDFCFFFTIRLSEVGDGMVSVVEVENSFDQTSCRSRLCLRLIFCAGVHFAGGLEQDDGDSIGLCSSFELSPLFEMADGGSNAVETFAMPSS